MPKGYWVARVDVRDPEGYKPYIAGAAAAFKKYNARFLARGGAVQDLEGSNRARNVIIEFDSVAQARACYDSPEYQAAMVHRQASSEGEILIVEGTPEVS